MKKTHTPHCCLMCDASLLTVALQAISLFNIFDKTLFSKVVENFTSCVLRYLSYSSHAVVRYIPCKHCLSHVEDYTVVPVWLKMFVTVFKSMHYGVLISPLPDPGRKQATATKTYNTIPRLVVYKQ
jgi:hypothetical protein